MDLTNTLTMNAGSDFLEEVIVSNGENPTDLTGYSFTFAAKYNYYDTLYIFNVNSDSGAITLTDPTNGKILIRVDANLTTGLPFKTSCSTLAAICELKCTDPDGVISTLLQANLVINESIIS